MQPTTTGVPASADTVLTERLIETAERVRASLPGLRRLVGHDGSDVPSERDFRHTAESELFITFIQHGGIPEFPDQFDWNSLKFLRDAARQLSRAVQGKNSNYGAYRMMHRDCRKEVPEEKRWDMWKSMDPDPNGSLRQEFIRRAQGLPVDTPQELSVERQEQRTLIESLREHLTPREFWLLREHYLYGRPITELADEIAAKDPRYQNHPKGQKNARNWAYVLMHRVRNKAAEALGVLSA